MLRRVACTARPSTSVVAAAAQRRAILDCCLTKNLVAHSFGAFSGTSYASAGAIMSSPVGTAALVGVSYHVSVIGLKHLWSTLELLTRDYLQDLVLAQTARYMILICLMICAEQLLIEA